MITKIKCDRMKVSREKKQVILKCLGIKMSSSQEQNWQ